LLEVVGKFSAVSLWLGLDTDVLSPVVALGSRLGCHLAPGDRRSSGSSPRCGVCSALRGDSSGGKSCLTSLERLGDFQGVPPLLEEVLEQPVGAKPRLGPRCSLQR